MSVTKVAGIAILLGLASAQVQAETALEVQSRCQEIAAAKILPDGMVAFRQTSDTGFCWGAFATIQATSRAVWPNGVTMLGFCPPADSTRVQMIKIFSKYVADHPESSHEDFSRIAIISLVAAFPCNQVTQPLTGR